MNLFAINEYKKAHGLTDKQFLQRLKMLDGLNAWKKRGCTQAPGRKSKSVYAPNQRRLTINGVEKPAGQWADEYGIPRARVYARLRKGMPAHKALQESDLRRRRHKR